MSKTSSVVKDRWNAKSYDSTLIRLPKGRKITVDDFARQQGESFNGLINRLIRTEMGLSEDEWKGVPNAVTVAAMAESDRIAADPDVSGYTDVNQLLADMKA